MAANANPAVNMNASTSNVNVASTSNGGHSAMPEKSAVGLSRRGLVHKLDLSDEWTSHEQSLLVELLIEYSSDPKVLRYGKISDQLQTKTVRHVAMRCIWMIEQENKEENGKRKREDNVIGGASWNLLDQNAQALYRISANISALKVHENTNLFCQTRNNIIKILNELNDMPEAMKQMPPLPVKLNEELVNSILPSGANTLN